MAAPEIMALVTGIVPPSYRSRDNDQEADYRHFTVGDHVSGNSEAGHVSSTITNVITSEVEFKGYKVHARRDEPQYEMKSDKTDHIAVHKGSALTKL